MNHDMYHILFLFQVLAISKLEANMQVTPTNISVYNPSMNKVHNFSDVRVKTTRWNYRINHL